MNVPFKGGNAGPTLPDFLGTKNEVCMFNRFFIRGTYKSSPCCMWPHRCTHTHKCLCCFSNPRYPGEFSRWTVFVAPVCVNFRRLLLIPLISSVTGESRIRQVLLRTQSSLKNNFFEVSYSYHLLSKCTGPFSQVLFFLFLVDLFVLRW